jgi:hypothetical protein
MGPPRIEKETTTVGRPGFAQMSSPTAVEGRERGRRGGLEQGGRRRPDVGAAVPAQEEVGWIGFRVGDLF